jgi:hypothetical protein
MRAFLQLKLALTSDPVVAYPRADRHYALIVDASTGSASSEGGMGAILAQIDKSGTFHVISYGSRQLVKHEKNYSPYLVEMAAAVWGMEFYNEYLKGKQFTCTQTTGHLKNFLIYIQKRSIDFNLQCLNMTSSFNTKKVLHAS